MLPSENTEDALRTQKIIDMQEAEIVLQQEIINGIIKSLKSAMLVNNDF